jgi:hypothetical protein
MKELPLAPTGAQRRDEATHQLLCPSARPEWPRARVIGVVTGSVSQPRVKYLEQSVLVSDELMQMTAPAASTEVFRMAGPCMRSACQHFQNARCHLAEKIVDGLPPVSETLPECSIRSHCRWFSQEGPAACFRCPQVVTDSPPLDSRMMAITDPSI